MIKFGNKSARQLIAQCVGNISDVFLGMACLLIIILLIILLTGSVGSFNRFLDAAFYNIFGSIIYQPDTAPEVMSMVMNTFYPGITTIIVVAGVVLVAVAIYLIGCFLQWFGKYIKSLILSMIDLNRGRSKAANYFMIFASWAVTIFLLWLTLNVVDTVYYLLIALALMIVNLILQIVADWLTSKQVAKNET